jgi:hypothetical protein
MSPLSPLSPFIAHLCLVRRGEVALTNRLGTRERLD